MDTPTNDGDWTVHSLNIHGIFFQKLIASLISKNRNVDLVSTEYPVEFPAGHSISRGQESRLDIRAWPCMTTPQCTFSCLIHSRFPVRFCSPVQQCRFFFPLSTRVYQAHVEGRGCLRFTREAGVVAIPLAQYHVPAWICSYENQNDFRRSASTLAGSFERTGRTQSMQPTSGPSQNTTN